MCVPALVFHIKSHLGSGAGSRAHVAKGAHQPYLRPWPRCSTFAELFSHFGHILDGPACYRLGDVEIFFLQVGSVLEASVASVKPYGIFVKLKGYRANGLVHLSQVRGACLLSMHDACPVC